MAHCATELLVCLSILALLGSASWSQFYETTEHQVAARWLFDEAGAHFGRGESVRDATGQGSEGKLAGATWVAGKRGKALAFDGKAAQAVVPSNERLNVQGCQITVTAWVKPESFKADLNAIAQKWGDASNRRQYQLTIQGPDNVGRWYISNDGKNHPSVVGKTAIPAGRWTHLAGTYDGSTIRLYVNGKLDGAVACQGNLHTSDIPVIIGGYGAPESGDRWFHGAIDDVVIARWAMTPDDVEAIMEGKEPKAAPPSPVVLLSARQLAAARQGVEIGEAGTWHAWAWQRGGAAVAWTLAGKKIGPATASGDASRFAWVKLTPSPLPSGEGRVRAREGRATSVTPHPIPLPEGEGGAVAALLLARDPSYDPARLWQLARVAPDAPGPVPDERPATCRHINARYTMGTYPTKEAWEKRAEWLRRRILVSCGLWPMPDKTPLNPHVFDRIERDGYTIEKAYFESRPGFYVCGNLYRPLGKKGPFPLVSCPHGHWAQGRFGHDEPKGSVPARCITLARIGFIVFSYDMVGYNDSGKQIGHTFASTLNEAWGLSLMHLQLWNGIRVIDFLQSLPDADPARVAVTGCSGGGTQTFMVMGIDPRVTVAAPVNMISGIMQGGCECENAPLLRVEANNIEIGALMAPRPLILCSVTGDWTKETPQVEYPSIRHAYELYGVPDRVINVHDKAEHGYNKVHREAVYTFFRKWMMDVKGEANFPEPPYTIEKKEDLLVWQGRELPKEAKTRASLEEYLIAEARKQRDDLLPTRRAAFERFSDSLGSVYRHAVLAELPQASEVEAKELGSADVGEIRVARLLLGRTGRGEQIPALLYSAKATRAKAPAALAVCPEGKAGLIDLATGKPGELLATLLERGHRVLAIDPYLVGEFHSPFAITHQKMEGHFFSTYNRTAVVQRVQDMLTALAWLEGRTDVRSVSLIGVGKAGAWCLLAAPYVSEKTRVVADLAQLTGDDDPRWLDDLFTPCILKAGGLATAAALAAPRSLFVHNVADSFDTKPLRAAYRSAEKAGDLRIDRRPCGAKAIARWLEER